MKKKIENFLQPIKRNCVGLLAKAVANALVLYVFQCCRKKIYHQTLYVAINFYLQNKKIANHVGNEEQYFEANEPQMRIFGANIGPQTSSSGFTFAEEICRIEENIKTRQRRDIYIFLVQIVSQCIPTILDGITTHHINTNENLDLKNIVLRFNICGRDFADIQKRKTFQPWSS